MSDTDQGISQDFCRCGHVAAVHADGTGKCGVCAADNRSLWAALIRCQNFRWDCTWQQTERSA